MNLKETLKGSETIVGIVRDIRKIKRIFYIASRRRKIKTYCKLHKIRKLQMGAGANFIDGWLDTDLDPPLFGSAVFLNVTKRFPIADDTFDYIYSEHLIEHLTYQQAVYMLRQCHRILKNNGMIRLATPDLKVLLALSSASLNQAQSNYIQWIIDHCVPFATNNNYAYVLNSAFRDWGHQFIYDENILCNLLESTGFKEINRRNIQESDDPNLRNIELHGVQIGNQDISNFETMVLEARCAK